MTCKSARLLWGFALLLLSGCATTAPRRQACLAQLRAHGVDPALQAKVERGRLLDLADLEQWARKGVPDPVTLDYLKLTHAIYALRAQDIDHLRANKVSDVVINYLLSTPALYRPYRDFYLYPYPYPYGYPYWGRAYFYYPLPYRYPIHPRPH